MLKYLWESFLKFWVEYWRPYLIYSNLEQSAEGRTQAPQTLSRVHTRVQNSKAPTLLDPLLNSCIRSSVQSLSILDKRGLTRPTSRVCCSRPLRGVLLSHLSSILVAMEMMALRRSPLLLFAIIIVAIAFRKQSPLPEDWKVMPTPPPSSGFALSERLRSLYPLRHPCPRGPVLPARDVYGGRRRDLQDAFFCHTQHRFDAGRWRFGLSATSKAISRELLQ